MRTLFSKRLLPVVVSFIFLAVHFPINATAQWHDKSDELPGLVSTKSIILVGVGTVAAVFLLVKLSKSAKDAKDKEKDSSALEYRESTFSAPQSYSQSRAQKTASEPRVALFVDHNVYGIKGIDSIQSNMPFKNKTISAGLSLGL